MMQYFTLESIANLMVPKMGILSLRYGMQGVGEIAFVEEVCATRITSLAEMDESRLRIHKMNYENFVHTAAEMMRKYASQIKP